MLQFGKYKVDTNEIINQLREENKQLKQLNTAALNVVFRIKDAAIALGCEANDGMAMLDYLIETARASVMVNQKNVELQSQLVAVQDSVVHGKCANSEPCATFCEAIATRKMFKQLQVGRDALAAQVGALKDALSKCRFDSLNQSLAEWAEIQASFELTPQHHLAAHDAEVAKAAYLQCKADFSQPHETWWVNGESHIELADKYATQLRAKAGKK